MKLELIQPGNKKLGKHMYMWNMTTSTVQCGRTCKGCYSAREEKRWPNVAKARQKRYEASLQPDFSSRIIKEINSLKTPPKYFRVHASSEFYDQAYISKWVSIATKLPNITFYAYTKRKSNFDFTQLQSLPNFILIDSFHFGRINYGKLDKAPKNAFICPDQPHSDTQCGITCTYCMKKDGAETNGVYFRQH